MDWNESNQTIPNFQLLIPNGQKQWIGTKVIKQFLISNY